jgi:hypothetical protein
MAMAGHWNHHKTLLGLRGKPLEANGLKHLKV